MHHPTVRRDADRLLRASAAWYLAAPAAEIAEAMPPIQRWREHRAFPTRNRRERVCTLEEALELLRGGERAYQANLLFPQPVPPEADWPIQSALKAAAWDLAAAWPKRVFAPV